MVLPQQFERNLQFIQSILEQASQDKVQNVREAAQLIMKSIQDTNWGAGVQGSNRPNEMGVKQSMNVHRKQEQTLSQSRQKLSKNYTNLTDFAKKQINDYNKKSQPQKVAKFQVGMNQNKNSSNADFLKQQFENLQKSQQQFQNIQTINASLHASPEKKQATEEIENLTEKLSFIILQQNEIMEQLQKQNQTMKGDITNLTDRMQKLENIVYTMIQQNDQLIESQLHSQEESYQQQKLKPEDIESDAQAFNESQKINQLSSTGMNYSKTFQKQSYQLPKGLSQFSEKKMVYENEIINKALTTQKPYRASFSQKPIPQSNSQPNKKNQQINYQIQELLKNSANKQSQQLGINQQQEKQNDAISNISNYKMPSDNEQVQLGYKSEANYGRYGQKALFSFKPAYQNYKNNVI